MSSPLPAMHDMKADGAERAPLRAAHADDLPAATRGGVIALDGRAASGALNDILAARMKELADRLAAGKALLEAADIDAPLGPSDVEIQPVSLAAITNMRGLAIPDTDDDDWLPATPPTQIAPSAPREPAEAVTAIIPAPPPPAEPAMSKKSSETVSERNLASLLAVLEQPTPLRLAGELPIGVLVPAESPAVPTPGSPPVSPADPAEDAPDSVVPMIGTDAPSEPADAAGDSSLLRQVEPVFATGEPLLLTDQSGDDIRLVDLVKRQQSLLDQLNSYPPAPPAPVQAVEPPAVPADRPAASAPVPARSVVDDLAPTRPMFASDKRRLTSDETPPPFPPTGVLRLTGNAPDEEERFMPERAPMIIERARAERSGLHRANNSAAAPSPLPAFAAGVAVALAIAGSLLFVL
jgi:hypothetical protein